MIEKPRISLETTVKNTNEFLDKICERLKSLLGHAFVANNNQTQFSKYLKNNLNDHKFLVICDFAKN